MPVCRGSLKWSHVRSHPVSPHPHFLSHCFLMPFSSFFFIFFPFLMSTFCLCLLILIFSVYACPNPALWILSLYDLITHVILVFQLPWFVLLFFQVLLPYIICSSNTVFPLEQAMQLVVWQ